MRININSIIALTVSCLDIKDGFTKCIFFNQAKCHKIIMRELKYKNNGGHKDSGMQNTWRPEEVLCAGKRFSVYH